MRVEDHRLQCFLGVAAGRRNPVQNGIEQLGNAQTRLGAHLEHFAWIDRQRLLHLQQHFVGPSVDQVDLVDRRHDVQVRV
jgi:hypothetical protein